MGKAQAQKTKADYLQAVNDARTALAAAQENVATKQAKLDTARADLDAYRLTQALANLGWNVGDKIKTTNRVEKALAKDGIVVSNRPKVTGFLLKDGTVFVVLDVNKPNGRAETLPLVMCKKVGN